MQAPWEQRPLYLFFTLFPGSGGMLGTKQTLWKYCWWLNEQTHLLAFITCQALYQKLHMHYPTLSSVINEWGGKWRKEFQGQPLVHYPQHPDISLHCLASSNHVLFQGPYTAIASQHIDGVTLQSRISIGIGKNSQGSFLYPTEEQ